MSLTECMEKHTHRQYLAWMQFFEDEFEHPSRSDYYLMQVSRALYELQHLTVKKEPPKVAVHDFVLKPDTSKKVTYTLKERLDMASSWALARWSTITGKKVNK